MTQSPVAGGEAVLIGLVMLAVVAFEALISALSGRGVRSVKIKPNGDGETRLRLERFGS